MPDRPALPPIGKLPGKLQELPPAWAHFCLHVERFVTRELRVDWRGKTLCVALSGGPDSVALLHVLRYLSVRNKLTVKVAHLDHGLRAESADEAAWVGELCAAVGVELLVRRVDVGDVARDRKVGVEEAGRDVRYGWFAELLAAGAADMVCTAHQLNDLAEDQLLRLIRGTGWPGLAGMAAWCPDRRVLRPLLTQPKDKLVGLLEGIGATWLEDPSNEDVGFTRNKVRHEILPRILEINPNWLEAVKRLWGISLGTTTHATDNTTKS